MGFHWWIEENPSPEILEAFYLSQKGYPDKFQLEGFQKFYLDSISLSPTIEGLSLIVWLERCMRENEWVVMDHAHDRILALVLRVRQTLSTLNHHREETAFR